MQAYRTLTSRWTPFAVRWAFPTAIDYYEVLRPRITLFRCSYPIPLSQGRLCGFSRSIGMSLPGFRLHLYTGGSIPSVIPLYCRAVLFQYVSLPNNGGSKLASFPDHLQRFQSGSTYRCLSNGSSPSHIQARLAALLSVGVPQLCLHYPQGFRQVLAPCPLPA